MDVREERGKAIAALGVVKKADKGDNIWTVPAQSRAGFYKVDLAGENPKCTCPDFELRNRACKHIFAVAHTVVQQQNSDGSTTVTETVTVMLPNGRPTRRTGNLQCSADPGAG